MQARSLMRGVPVKAAMQTLFRSLSPYDTVRTATDELLRGSQTDFPVVDDRGLRGMLSRNGLMEAIHRESFDEPISSAAGVEDVAPASEEELLEDVVSRMREEGLTAIPVVRHGEVVGLVTFDNVGELLMVQGASKSRPAGAGAERSRELAEV